MTLPSGWHWVDDWRIVTSEDPKGCVTLSCAVCVSGWYRYLSDWHYAADWNAAKFEPIENEVKQIRAASGKLVSSGDQVRRR